MCMRTFLLVLRRFSFPRYSKYVEDPLDWIDAPLLERFVIILFEEPTYGTPQLVRFSCTLTSESPIEARLLIEGN